MKSEILSSTSTKTISSSYIISKNPSQLVRKNSVLNLNPQSEMSLLSYSVELLTFTFFASLFISGVVTLAYLKADYGRTLFYHERYYNLSGSPSSASDGDVAFYESKQMYCDMENTKKYYASERDSIKAGFETEHEWVWVPSISFDAWDPGLLEEHVFDVDDGDYRLRNTYPPPLLYLMNFCMITTSFAILPTLPASTFTLPSITWSIAAFSGSFCISLYFLLEYPKHFFEGDEMTSRVYFYAQNTLVYFTPLLVLIPLQNRLHSQHLWLKYILLSVYRMILGFILLAGFRVYFTSNFYMRVFIRIVLFPILKTISLHVECKFLTSLPSLPNNRRIINTIPTLFLLAVGVRVSVAGSTHGETILVELLLVPIEIMEINDFIYGRTAVESYRLFARFVWGLFCGCGGRGEGGRSGRVEPVSSSDDVDNGNDDGKASMSDGGIKNVSRSELLHPELLPVLDTEKDTSTHTHRGMVLGGNVEDIEDKDQGKGIKNDSSREASDQEQELQERTEAEELNLLRKTLFADVIVVYGICEAVGVTLGMMSVAIENFNFSTPAGAPINTNTAFVNGLIVILFEVFIADIGTAVYSLKTSSHDRGLRINIVRYFSRRSRREKFGFYCGVLFFGVVGSKLSQILATAGLCIMRYGYNESEDERGVVLSTCPFENYCIPY